MVMGRGLTNPPGEREDPEIRSYTASVPEARTHLPKEGLRGNGPPQGGVAAGEM